jgi:hypothetical protein
MVGAACVVMPNDDEPVDAIRLILLVLSFAFAFGVGWLWRFIFN